MLLKLHKHIADLKNHSKELLKEKVMQGFDVEAFTQNLTTLADNYAYAFFSDKKPEEMDEIKTNFSSALKEGYNKMGEHRAKWKIILANIVLAATGVGLLINYMISGNVFFFKTKRQNQIETIGNDVNMLYLKS